MRKLVLVSFILAESFLATKEAVEKGEVDRSEKQAKETDWKCSYCNMHTTNEFKNTRCSAPRGCLGTFNVPVLRKDANPGLGEQESVEKPGDSDKGSDVERGLKTLLNARSEYLCEACGEIFESERIDCGGPRFCQKCCDWSPGRDESHIAIRLSSLDKAYGKPICHACGVSIKTPEEAGGCRVRCPSCDQRHVYLNTK